MVSRHLKKNAGKLVDTLPEYRKKCSALWMFFLKIVSPIRKIKGRCIYSGHLTKPLAKLFSKHRNFQTDQWSTTEKQRMIIILLETLDPI